mmetsp:Transcript_41603/g.115794  ORF Transcript_41603/g.115794 Transcript_41603/m.115794 type:complete len:437 (-) Transcript_41603:103-1413(-)
MWCWPWCLGGTCCLCGVLKCVKSLRSRQAEKKLRAAAARGRFVAMNDAEIQSLEVAAQATATVYEGACPEPWLRSRVAEIVHANPWLAGRLKTNPDTGKLALWIPDSIDYQDFLEVVPVVDEAAVTGNCSPQFFVKPGPELVDSDEPVCRILALTEPTHRRWGLQISMSHMLTDGHTFYTIYGMLDKDAEVWSMEVERVKKFNPMTCLKGTPMHGKWMFFIIHMIRRKMECLPKDPAPIYRVRRVREEWVEEQKRAHVAGLDAPFLSANDMLTSWFFRNTQPAAGAMVFNMRDRMCGLEAKHAGCYGTLMIYYPNEYQEPANIRRSVSRKSPACTLDGSRQKPGQGGKCGMVTSWHMFYHDVNLDGCRQLTHFPIGALPMDPRVAPPLPMAAIFRPAAGELAMVTMTAEELPEVGPLGDAVWGTEALLRAANQAPQ